MQTILISPDIREKLEIKHKVSEFEIKQCFDNRCGLCLIDDREDHKTDSLSLWFVAETNRARILKVVFMYIDGNIHMRAAYEANPSEIEMYESEGK